MDLYTLDENFLRKDIVDDFSSCIWTERYTKAGDVTLVVPATQENITKLPEDSFLSLAGSKEVMILESASIEKGLLKLTGPSLLKFLNERVVRDSAIQADRYHRPDKDTPGLLMALLFFHMVISGFVTGGGGPVGRSRDDIGIDGEWDTIANSGIGPYDNTGEEIDVAIPYGPLYDALTQLAETYQIGQSFYLDYAVSSIDLDGNPFSDYRILYKTYRGRDLTSDQTTYPFVRFSPNTDSLSNIKELRSVAGYKNVAYVFAPNNVVPGVTTPGIAYADEQSKQLEGFKRRVLMEFATDITTDKVGGDATVLMNMLNQRAKDALANNNYTKVVDGEVVPQNQYKYGTDYTLGDIVEFQSVSGLLSKARVTEYIRTQDSTGERAYPTISVI